MKILIATGIFPPQIGGPAQYAKNLAEEFENQGNEVEVLTYKLERSLPSGIRHLLFFFRMLFALLGKDLVIALDTFSVGLPSVLACKMLQKKIIIRTGGDFLWEGYVERTKDMVLFRDFYTTAQEKWNKKERVIFKLTRWLLQSASAVVFSTKWQRDTWTGAYSLDEKKSFIIEYFFGEKKTSFPYEKKNFVFAGRELVLKNSALTKTVFGEINENDRDVILDSEKLPFEAFIKKIQSCYAIIVPSLSEIGSISVLDAIQYNKPFILTRESGLYEKLKDVGLFVDPKNKEDMKAKVLLLSEPFQYAIYKKKVELFSFTHTWKEIVQEFVTIYGKI